MTRLHEFLRRLQFRFKGDRFDADLAEEMRLHMDLRAEERARQGMSEADAEAAARRQFGNPSLLQETSRETWGWTFLDRLKQDLSYSIRALAAHPAFTATAVLSLALGIGANTAIFSIINAVMLRSLPVEDPQALLQIKLNAYGDDEINTPIWEQIRDNQQAFSGVLAYSSERFAYSQTSDTRFVQGTYVSGDFFRVLGVPPLLGRTFTAADDKRGGGKDGPVAVVSYAFWKNHLNGDEQVLGKTIRLNRQTFAIVGVTPPWFTGLEVDRGYDVAIPIGCQPLFSSASDRMDERFHWWLRILGRVAPGDTFQLANDRMQAIAPHIFRATALPGPDGRMDPEYAKSKFVLTPAGLGFSQTRLQYRTALFALMSIVGLVLLIACANIANLISARGAARQRELSVRMAIGATRRRVIRQLMTESLLLAALGAVGGFFLAIWGSRMLVQVLSTTRNPIDFAIAPDWRLLAFTTAVAVVTAILFGLAPAIRSTRLGLNTVLKENQRGAVTGSSRWNGAKLLVAGQIGVSMMLLVGAGLFVGTLRNLLAIDPGFDRRNIMLMSVDLPQNTTPQQRIETYNAILNRVQAVPGVASAAHTVLTPISPQGWGQPTHPEGFVSNSPRDTMLFLNQVSAGYFRTMRTPVLLGREFTERDTLNSPRVMVINESAAHAFFGSANPVGKTIGLDRMGKRGERDVYQIVGVVKDTKYNRLNEEPRRIGYFAGGQDAAPRPALRYVIQSENAPESLTSSLRSAVAAAYPDAVLEFRSLALEIHESLLQPRLVAVLSATFGGLALLLAMVGLYGATMYSVTRRKGEIGIRMAMGAQRSSVIWLMMRDSIALVTGGMILGAAASFAGGLLIGSLLFGVTAGAPEPLAVAACLLVFAAAIAAYLPARRAARLDPMVALREE